MLSRPGLLQTLRRTFASTSTSTASSPSLIASLKQISPALLDQNPYELDRHGRGESFHPSLPPDAICHPRSAEEVKQIVKLCASTGTALVPFGAGTSLEGHVGNASPHITISTTKHFNKLVSVDPASLQCTVQPGITRHQLNHELRDTGLQFMVDPGADASIGGMAATNASGTSAVKFGVMRDNVLQVKVVTASGEEVTAGSRTFKNSAGYDLKNLFVGSEGTLGIITELTLRLHPIVDNIVSSVCAFENLTQACDAVVMLLSCGVPVAKCEVLDGPAIHAFNIFSKDVADMTPQPHLFVELQDISDGGLLSQQEMVEEILRDCGGSGIEFSADPAVRKKLWAARHATYYASCALRPGEGKGIVTDACVPLGKLASVIAATAKDVEESGVVGPVFGHAGDGNFHCILPVRDTDSDEYLKKLEDVNDRLISRTLAAGGTCTGEHGVGSGKAKYLDQQYGEGAVEIMRTIKKSMDPQNIFNPGKIIPNSEG
ncbi:hypothetical protein TrST_g1317 [Triparma strigata]|uniref:D-lactate dehydrogenase (cytochrome) n=1 Tax=Triparma strigata TaxID=1606541 RepID=A0A9W7BAR9_9STRA|nr:hypothetical protein TrST_g1317 [Triparma strigata]